MPRAPIAGKAQCQGRVLVLRDHERSIEILQDYKFTDLKAWMISVGFSANQCHEADSKSSLMRFLRSAKKPLKGAFMELPMPPALLGVRVKPTEEPEPEPEELVVSWLADDEALPGESPASPPDPRRSASRALRSLPRSKTPLGEFLQRPWVPNSPQSHSFSEIEKVASRSRSPGRSPSPGRRGQENSTPRHFKSSLPEAARSKMSISDVQRVQRNIFKDSPLKQLLSSVPI